jgi:hypothetical protein
LNKLAVISKHLNDHEGENEDIQIASNETLEAYKITDQLMRFLANCDLASLELADEQKQGIELILKEPEWAKYLLQARNEHQEECAEVSV